MCYWRATINKCFESVSWRNTDLARLRSMEERPTLPRKAQYTSVIYFLGSRHISEHSTCLVYKGTWNLQLTSTLRGIDFLQCTAATSLCWTLVFTHLPLIQNWSLGYQILRRDYEYYQEPAHAWTSLPAYWLTDWLHGCMAGWLPPSSRIKHHSTFIIYTVKSINMQEI